MKNDKINNLKVKCYEQENEINNLKVKCYEQENEINNLKKELSIKENKIKSFPKLINTSLGERTSDSKITFRNWWVGDPNKQWFTLFLKHKFPDVDYNLNLFSVFGQLDNIQSNVIKNKVFFSGENMNFNENFTYINKQFGEYALNYVDFAMGFDLIDNNKYLRLPLWILWNFEPNSTEETIENKINLINSLNYEKNKNVAVISSHDKWGTRKFIIDDIQNFVNIDYAGRWRNNTSDLKTKYNDNHGEYLKQFKFYVCAENTIDNGYVTEKIFNSIKSNCIPLYAGGGNYLEPEVLNSDSIIRWEPNKDNSDQIELFKMLISDEKSYKEFKDQDALLETSVKYIFNKFEELEKHFENLIYG